MGDLLWLLGEEATLDAKESKVDLKTAIAPVVQEILSSGVSADVRPLWAWGCGCELVVHVCGAWRKRHIVLSIAPSDSEKRRQCGCTSTVGDRKSVV